MRHEFGFISMRGGKKEKRSESEREREREREREKECLSKHFPPSASSSIRALRDIITKISNKSRSLANPGFADTNPSFSPTLSPRISFRRCVSPAGEQRRAHKIYSTPG
jgi:hypothetical protein